MLRRLMLTLAVWMVSAHPGFPITALDASAVNKSVVFLFSNDSADLPNTLVATGFLVVVPNKNGQGASYLLITARHVVDPVWVGCLPQILPEFL
jgi:hypothetical protein